MRQQQHKKRHAKGIAVCLGLAALLCATAAQAWSLNIGAYTSRRLFLQVGNGYTNISQWGNNTTVNEVSTTVPLASVMGGTALIMDSNSTQTNSAYDNYTTCTGSPQVYVGAAYQRSKNNQSVQASLQVSSPANLVNANGDTIPLTEISWTTSATGSSAPNIIPAGTFTGGTQFLTSFAFNTMIENCHTFTYANTTLRAPGVYTGRVTYTLSSP